MKRIMLLAVILTLLAFMVASATNVAVTQKNNTSNMAPMRHDRLINGDEDFLANVPVAPYNPEHIAASPGDTIGFTAFDYQSNGSSGNRVAVDHLGGLHFVWMRAIGGLGPRTAYYNYKSSPAAPANWPASGIVASISGHINDGYTQIGVTTTDLAVLGYHNGVTESLYVATDFATGFGDFPGGTFRVRMLFAGDVETALWPYITVDRSNRYHFVASEAAPTAGEVQTLGYTRTTNGGSTWITPVAVDTNITISAIVTSSPVSNKVAIVYTHPFDTTDQWHNDVYYILSQDGVTWDFRNGKVNVTEYNSDPDSIWAYTDCDAVFDFNDNLHIVWNGQPLSNDPAGGIYFHTKIYHFDIGSGTINVVAESDSEWPVEGCDFGAWNWGMAKMSIGSDSLTNGLFVTFTGWKQYDCSAGGFANGDIFMSYSTNGGANWTLRGNMTDSWSDSCLAGECDSDHWSSLAERVDANLHLFYSNDLDAGGIPQSEGTLTNNPLLYYSFPNPIRNSAVPTAPDLVTITMTDTIDNGIYVWEMTEPVGVTHYEIQIATDPAFNNVIESDNNLTFKEFTNVNPMAPGVYYWRERAAGYFGTSAWGDVDTIDFGGGGGGCDYTPGDINNNGSANGIDVVYGVAYFKGGNPPPVNCNPDCPSQPNPFYAAGDVNGNCAFNGIDITFFVAYLKGIQPALQYCANCPPAAR